MNFDRTCQILIIGDSSVGKTSILTRYTNGTFKEEYLATVGLDYYSKDEIFNNKTINVKLWDTAGQERYKSLTQSYFKNAEGVIVAYDITNTESFDNLKFWINSIKANMENKNIFIPVIIIGNKTDMEESREIMTEDAEKFAEENKYKYFETSAKTGEGIDKAIRDLINQILNQSENNDDQKEFRKDSVQIKENTEEKSGKKKKGCC
jgi:small GTP-binding protein